jgi:hypothetical protein
MFLNQSSTNTKVLLMLLIVLFSFVIATKNDAKINRFASFSKRNKEDKVNATNAYGLTSAGSHVTSSPYKIDSCEQIVEIEAQTLTDLNDYTQKESAFFTMSMYLVNIFGKKDPSTLKGSVMMNELVDLPQIIPGSVACLKFSGQVNGLNMCLPDKATAELVLTTYNDLMKCRMGDNLKSATASTIQRLLKSSCLGLDVNFDIKKFGNDYNKAKASLQDAVNKALKGFTQSMNKAVKKAEDEKDPTDIMNGSIPGAVSNQAEAKRRRRRY